MLSNDSAKSRRQADGEPGFLALANGKVFRGQCFGALRDIDNYTCGELVFNTSMTGYQEILTDPSYAGQIMTFTLPHVGNVGCNDEDAESSRIHVEGIVVRAAHKFPSNFRATVSLSEYLMGNNVMGIEGVDTRDLVTVLRNSGAMMAVLAGGSQINPDDLVDLARSSGSMTGKDYVKQVTCTQNYTWDFLPWSIEHRNYRRVPQDQLVSRPHVVVVDCGVKHNILRLLVDVGFRVTVVPAGTSSGDILELRPDGVFLSNGPGDPAALDYVVRPVRDLLGVVPIFGICLGHQILARALGGKTYKLKLGHRGANHPVRDQMTGKVEITAQNHGFAVDQESIGNKAFISHINLNDMTVAGIDAKDRRAFSIQYHPEASPGPHDSRYLFERFYQMAAVRK